MASDGVETTRLVQHSHRTTGVVLALTLCDASCLRVTSFRWVQAIWQTGALDQFTTSNATQCTVA
jgi:hypothetical protein